VLQPLLVLQTLARGGVMVLVARFRTILDQIVPETTFTPRLKVHVISAAEIG
jgi:hypothetical protein